MRSVSRSSSWLALGLLVSLPAAAVPATVTPLDTPACDTLSSPTNVDELGLSAAFPIGERIFASATNSTTTACSSGTVDNPLTRNFSLNITNLNATAFTDLWYVANVSTTISNADGLINGMPAFKIDTVGVNTPLAGESILADGIFAPGETWSIILQDFSNSLSGPGALGVVGVPDLSGASASIIAYPVPVPEPGTAALVGLGLVALAARHRTRG
jgi:PEP-CTERM motif-containing protein